MPDPNHVLRREPGVGCLALPLVHLLFRFVFRHAVPLLYLAGQLIAATGNDIEVVIGQLAPLLLGPACVDGASHRNLEVGPRTICARAYIAQLEI